jgi:hypothetical protein
MISVIAAGLVPQSESGARESRLAARAAPGVIPKGSRADRAARITPLHRAAISRRCARHAECVQQSYEAIDRATLAAPMSIDRWEIDAG